MARTALPPRWWLTPLLYAVAALAAGVTVLVFSATAREVVSRAFSMLVGALATPFILESVTALAGLAIVITINQWRLNREGDGWVYLAKTEPDATVDFEGRLAMAEKYLELGLAREALDHLDQLSAEEQSHERARHARAAALAQLG
jgi:uncharacterized membrane protein